MINLAPCGESGFAAAAAQVCSTRLFIVLCGDDNEGTDHIDLLLSWTKDRRRPSEARVAAAAASAPPAEETEWKGPSSGSVRRGDSPVTGAKALETTGV